MTDVFETFIPFCGHLLSSSYSFFLLNSLIFLSSSNVSFLFWIFWIVIFCFVSYFIINKYDESAVPSYCMSVQKFCCAHQVGVFSFSATVCFFIELRTMSFCEATIGLMCMYYIFSFFLFCRTLHVNLVSFFMGLSLVYRIHTNQLSFEFILLFVILTHIYLILLETKKVGPVIKEFKSDMETQHKIARGHHLKELFYFLHNTM
jgi:hypothetical protein